MIESGARYAILIRILRASFSPSWSLRSPCTCCTILDVFSRRGGGVSEESFACRHGERGLEDKVLLRSDGRK